MTKFYFSFFSLEFTTNIQFKPVPLTAECWKTDTVFSWLHIIIFQTKHATFTNDLNMVNTVSKNKKLNKKFKLPSFVTTNRANNIHIGWWQKRKWCKIFYYYLCMNSSRGQYYELKVMLNTFPVNTRHFKK